MEKLVHVLKFREKFLNMFPKGRAEADDEKVVDALDQKLNDFIAKLNEEGYEVEAVTHQAVARDEDVWHYFTITYREID